MKSRFFRRWFRFLIIELIFWTVIYFVPDATSFLKKNMFFMTFHCEWFKIQSQPPHFKVECVVGQELLLYNFLTEILWTYCLSKTNRRCEKLSSFKHFQFFICHGSLSNWVKTERVDLETLQSCHKITMHEIRTTRSLRRETNSTHWATIVWIFFGPNRTTFFM